MERKYTQKGDLYGKGIYTERFMEKRQHTQKMDIHKQKGIKAKT